MPKKAFSGSHPIVKNVTTRSMGGDNLLEKEVNAFLTKQFISSSEIPSNECLSEAKTIIAMVRKYDRTGK